jgi:glycosyltransferase involved in cell wall biosynthesis
MRNLVVLVPSRNRPQNIAELIKSFDETETESDLIVIVDDDEPQMDAYLQLGCDVLMVEKQGKGMAKPLNFAARHYAHKYRHFAFLGDDHRPRTKNWDLQFINTLDELGTGLVYGNDLLQGENLATAIGMTGNIVNALGGMVPPDMIHLYLDNFWMTLGKDLNALRYISEVVLEHLHPIAGKAKWDEGYREVNAEEVYSADRQALDDYLKSNQYQQLLEALR